VKAKPEGVRWRFGYRTKELNGITEFLADYRRTIRRGSIFLAGALRGLWRHRHLPPNASRAQCAEWLHEACARTLHAIDVQLDVEGQLPTRGLIVSNHLSYVDIVALSATLPCVFVSKAEVAQWPIFGPYSRWSGTVFVRRHDRGDVARANDAIRDALREGAPVVLFPEGTTTDGQRVLRFHSTMLQPAIDAAAPVTPCAIQYVLEDGDPSREVCWWGDMTLLPHLWNLLGKKTIRARIAFGRPVIASGDRKQLSGKLHEEVVRLQDVLSQKPLVSR
jgi:lyso-ornithine lipid O-acyltransferase